VQLSKLFAHT
jgi:hypothetical protein